MTEWLLLNCCSEVNGFTSFYHDKR